MLLPAAERRAIRAQVKEAARRSRYNRSEKGRVARAKTKTLTKRTKEERNIGSSTSYPGDGEGFETETQGQSSGGGAKKKSKSKPCQCGAVPVHYRSNHHACLKNKKNKQIEPTLESSASIDTARAADAQPSESELTIENMVMVDGAAVAEAEAAVDTPDFDIEERMEEEMEAAIAADEIRGVDTSVELGALSDEEDDDETEY